MVADDPFAATETAGRVFHNGKGLREDLLEVGGPGGGEFVLQIVEKFLGVEDVSDHGCGIEASHLRGSDKTSGAFELRRERLESFGPLLQKGGVLLFRVGAEDALAVAFDAEAVAIEVGLPGGGLLSEKLFGLVLQILLDLIDFDDDRSNAANDACVSAADDEFEKPLDHGERGKLRRERGILSHFTGFSAKIPAHGWPGGRNRGCRTINRRLRRASAETRPRAPGRRRSPNRSARSR